MITPDRFRVQLYGYPPTIEGDPFGAFLFPKSITPRKRTLKALADDGEESGWEHVSVSIQREPGKAPLMPQWDEMDWVRHKFWHPDDTVVQFHPPRSKYANDPNAPHVLHLWKPAAPNPPIECPDPIFVAREIKAPQVSGDPRDRQYLEDISRLVQKRLPDGHGFILLVSSAGEDQRLYYTSSFHREDATNVLKEWLLKVGPEEWLKHLE